MKPKKNKVDLHVHLYRKTAPMRLHLSQHSLLSLASLHSLGVVASRVEKFDRGQSVSGKVQQLHLLLQHFVGLRCKHSVVTCNNLQLNAVMFTCLVLFVSCEYMYLGFGPSCCRPPCRTGNPTRTTAAAGEPEAWGCSFSQP